MYSISFDQPEASFSPGEAISGAVNWTELNEKTTRFEIRLIWFTEGKGDTDVQIIGMIPVEQPTSNGEARFTFVAPTRPFSFSGKLISLIWAIEIVEFPSRDGDKAPLTISPTRNEIVLDKVITDSKTKRVLKFSS